MNRPTDTAPPTNPSDPPALAADMPPYCDKHGCRGRWHDDLPHTLCDKAPTTETLAETLARTDPEYLRDNRAIAVIHVHEDGSATTSYWLVSVDLAEQVVALLDGAGGEAFASFAPPGSVDDLMKIGEGLPTT